MLINLLVLCMTGLIWSVYELLPESLYGLHLNVNVAALELFITSVYGAYDNSSKCLQKMLFLT